MSAILQIEHASAYFDHESAESVIASFAEAVNGMKARAAHSNGSVVWSTLDVTVDVATVSESRLTERYQRVHAGRSTLTVAANVIYEVS